MAGISDKALKGWYPENKYRYNGGNELQNKEFSDGGGLELYTTDHRLYDPQLGRFVQMDAYADEFENWSPYTFGNDDPTLLNDPSGLLSDSTHPQERTPVTVTHTKSGTSNNVIFADLRPVRKNPNYILGGNQPAYTPFTQTRPDQWDPVITKQFVKMTVTGASLIPIGRGLKVLYSVYKVFQAIKRFEDAEETAGKVADHALNKNGGAMRGWKGGRQYENDGRGGGEILPTTDGSGNPITYKEYDVWPRVPGQNRGTDRIVVGSDKSAYYTGDHYQTFFKIR
ncbi:MAG: hypothetical protein J0H74_36815 [Chitinophagaceae bacterium]|nr:hypothetical protein [Chitinophagaceae bacterium]